jgi:hypothetical protein
MMSSKPSSIFPGLNMAVMLCEGTWMGKQGRRGQRSRFATMATRWRMRLIDSNEPCEAYGGGDSATTNSVRDRLEIAIRFASPIPAEWN